MLEGLNTFIKNLRKFDFAIAMNKSIEQNKDVLSDMVRKQLEAGKDGNDTPNTIFGRSGYSPRTVNIKTYNGTGLGKVTDRVTNYMTGDFYSSLVATFEGQVFELDSDVPYFGDIRLYSKDALLEVSESNRRDFAEAYTLPGVAQQLKTKTGLIITTKS